MNLINSLRSLAAGLALLMPALSARAQCEPAWLPGGTLGGLNGLVDDTVAWDPDGPGPAPQVLVAGGSFHAAGDITVSNIAIWDGARWSSPGAGLPASVSAVEIFNGQLHAASDRHVYRWDGAAWTSIGESFQGTPRVMHVYRGELYVGGSFYRMSGVQSPNLIRWNGAEWLVMPASPNNVVSAMGIYRNELIIGGYFSIAGGSSSPGVAAWDGSSWTQMPGLEQWVYAIAVHNDQLYVGGSFFTPTLKYMARRSGTSWVQAGEPDAPVRALHAQPGGLLFAAGRFTSIGGISANRIAAWTGAAWMPLTSGITPSPAIPSPDVLTLDSFAGSLIAGGEFTVAGGGPGRSIAEWDGNHWSSLGEETGPFTDSTSEVRVLHRRDGLVYTGGVNLLVDGLPAGGLVTWDGAAWDIPGGGVDGEVSALVEHEGGLVVAGKFSIAGDRSAANIALWNGEQYLPLGDGLTATLGVFALTHYQGELIAAGRFSAAGGSAANNIAAWNGSSWRPLGNGVSSTVRALAVYNGDLYAGGEFTSAGPVGSAAFRIARWNGSAWSPVGDGGLNNTVYALQVDGDRLLVGGAFTASLTLDGVNYAVAWNGTSWARLPGLSGTCFLPTSCASGIRAMVLRDGLLTAAGEVATVGSTANTVVQWNGAAWSRLPGDIARDCASQPVPAGCHADGVVHALLEDGPGLMIAGRFTRIGDDPQYNWARYGVACEADLACDGLVDFADYLAFLNLYEAQDARVDFNHDGSVDFADYLEFLNRYDAGC